MSCLFIAMLQTNPKCNALKKTILFYYYFFNLMVLWVRILDSFELENSSIPCGADGGHIWLVDGLVWVVQDDFIHISGALPDMTKFR